MRNIRTPVVALCLLALVFSACSSTLPSKLPETMKQACSLYQKAKPLVLMARAEVVAHWDAFPADTQKAFRELDSILPALDAAGQSTCDLSTITLPKDMTWDDALSVVLKVVSVALELKAKGAF